MLVTNGRTGNVGKLDINSGALVEVFKKDESFPDPWEEGMPSTISAGFKVPYMNTRGTLDTSDDVPYGFLKEVWHDVYVTYTLSWEVPKGAQPGQYRWVVETVKDDRGTVFGTIYQNSNNDNNLYILDVRQVNLNTLMTGFFLGQEDGWAKTLVGDFFYTAWPLTLVFWVVFLLTIAGYLVVLVVGIRYVIRSVIVVLRKTGYIASDFVTEVVTAVKSEIPLVQAEEVEELSFADMKKQLSDRMDAEKAARAREDMEEARESGTDHSIPMEVETIEEIRERESKMKETRSHQIPKKKVAIEETPVVDTPLKEDKVDTVLEKEDAEEAERKRKANVDKMNDIFS